MHTVHARIFLGAGALACAALVAQPIGAARAAAAGPPTETPRERPGAVPPSATGEAPKQNASKQTSEFLATQSSSALLMTSLGDLARTKAKSPEVQGLGQRMAMGGLGASDQLQRLADEAGLEVPHHMKAKDEATLAAVDAKSGHAFDVALVKAAIKGYESVIDDIHSSASKLDDHPALRHWAESLVPAYELDLKAAREVGATVGVDEKKKDDGGKKKVDSEQDDGKKGDQS